MSQIQEINNYGKLSSTKTQRVEVDFGSLPVADKIFVVYDINIKPDSIITATQAYDAPTGKVRLQLTSTEASAIPAGRYLYDIEITNTVTSAKTRILEGIVVVTPEITQT